MRTVQESLTAAVSRLEAAGVPDAKWDAQELLTWAGGPDRTHLPLVRDAALSEGTAARFEEGLCLRERRVPLQQILGTAWFMGLPFSVSEDVLCPRSDTEVLVELALKRMEAEGRNDPRILDLCCGSGCIGISLARFLPGAKVILSDISSKALALAKKNAGRNAVAEQILTAQGDLLDAVTENGITLKERLKRGNIDLICCNPPYIPSDEINALMPEVRDHEPVLALDGGADGLDFYRRLARELRPYKTPVLLEIGCEQGAAVREIFESTGAEPVMIHRDLAGLDRVAEVNWSKYNV